MQARLLRPRRRFVVPVALFVVGTAAGCGETGIAELDELLGQLDPEPDPEPEPDGEPDPEPDRPPPVPDETPPTVTLLEPTEDCLSGVVTFLWTATDDDSGVGLVRAELAGTLLNVTELEPGKYSATADVSPLFQGLHAFRASAIDTSNNFIEIERVYGKVDPGGYLVAADFTCGEPPDGGLVDTEPPELEILRPEPGALPFVGDEVEVQASASDDVGPLSLSASVGGSTVTMVGGAGIFSGTLSLAAVPEGVQTVTVTARDGADREQSATTQVRVDHTPPVVTVQSPAEGATVVALTDVVVTATDDQAVTRVLLLENGEALAIAIQPDPGTDDRYALFYSLACAGLPRPVTFEIRALDEAGNATSVFLNVTVTPDGCSG